MGQSHANTELAIGRWYLEAGDQREATHYLRSALLISPQNAEIHFLLGKSLHYQGYFDTAQVSFREAVRLEPDKELSERSIVSFSFPSNLSHDL